jgi:hypothetical protein
LSLTIISGLLRAANGIELACHPAAGDRRVDDQRQAFACEVVDNNKHPEAAAIGQHIGDEVEAPALVGTLWQSHWRSRAQCPFAATAATNRQPLFSVDPEQLLVVQLDALPTQQDVQAPIAEPPAFGSKATQPLAELSVIVARADIAVGLRRNADQRAGAPLRVALLVNCPGHHHPPGNWASEVFSKSLAKRRHIEHPLRQ